MTEDIHDWLTEDEINLACETAPALRMLHSPGGAAIFFTNGFIKKIEAGARFQTPPLFMPPGGDIGESFSSYKNSQGVPPSVVLARGLGAYALGHNIGEAASALRAFVKSSGAGRGLFSGIPSLAGTDDAPPAAREAKKTPRLAGKIAVVTGSAQGFGKGIAEAMAAEGALVVVADLNVEGARKCASEIEASYGAGHAAAVRVDVSDETSVREMTRSAVLNYGGLDIMVSNAGIAIAGGLSEMTKEKFELVTSVNYTGFFLCAKYAAVPMKIQRAFNPSYTADIIEINSKSGLEGSNKNFAYAGSKFGGLGLTQSFALEMVAYGVKVNAICPGNYLDGPLWSDPEHGLFRQYFEAGKVPGATSVADVRAFYESKVPMRRGCTPEDVARAIFYAVEQQYETGQAIPVTGGQIMLK
ncbi:MAG: SDR family NAD(P)-dependent oxidoreductase [Synergistaceae bacterium]|nr:SDR family NAD(P)-dependent oxidoreductase [Synergistaceae bacterium]